jgi:SAM-dependent methyltransferase
MQFNNSYEDTKRAESYSKLEFPGTYYLAYRDLPEIILRHTNKGKALDFGCGTGRSTRFLKKLGFEAVGVDISPDMIEKAKEADPKGEYQVIKDGDFNRLIKNSFDLVLSVFTFDNIPGVERRIKLFKGLGRLLKEDGIMVVLDATPELYINDWASFTMTVFEENKLAKSGEITKVIITDVEDGRPVHDILWTDEDYKEQFCKAGLDLIKTYHPLAREDEPYTWVNETQIPPWVIYVLKKDLSRAL